MMKNAYKLIAIHGLALTLMTSEAYGVVLDFNNLSGTTGGVQMPVSFPPNGLVWGITSPSTGISSSAWHRMVNPTNPSDTFLAPIRGSGVFVLGNAGTDFFFEGADFWSRRGADANGSFYFQLWHNDALVYDGIPGGANEQRMDFTATPTFMTPGYAGLVDLVSFYFEPKGGGNGDITNGFAGDWDHFAMDNFQYSSVVVPLPASSLLMISGLLVLTAKLRRKSLIA